MGWSQSTTGGEHVSIRWLAPSSFQAGRVETIGLYFEVDPDWHVYWRNPGDSGAAPRFNFSSDTADVSDPRWPFPTRLPIAHLTNLGYEGDVAYLFEIRPQAGAERISLTVDLEWLVCKVDCIPGFGTMTLSRPVGTLRDWAETDLALKNSFAARVPSQKGPWRATSLATTGDNKLRLGIQNADAQRSSTPPEVFPLDGNLLNAATPELEAGNREFFYTFAMIPGASPPATTDFVIVDGDQSWRLDQIAISSPPSTPPVSDLSTPAAKGGIWLLLLSAFAGGVILNLMPCVFPVLSIKLLGVAETAATGRIREGLLYTAGVLVTFGLLGGVLVMLRAAGASIGWGFQLQSPAVILSLVLLFWLMALSFSGVFEFGHRLMNLAGKSRGGAFATGVLAVFVATPCTGPFMGTALGAAVVLPAPSAMAIFLGLGAGLAAPFLVLSATPSLLDRLPPPGPWMEKLRQFMAFPLYATVVWLLWVLGRLRGDDGWLAGCLLLLAVTFALWLGRNFGRSGRLAASITGVTAVAFALISVAPNSTGPPGSTAVEDDWQAYDKSVVREALAENRPVFIDYTAAWCITCQVNKKLVLESGPVMDMFNAHDVLLIRADWTNHNPAITEALARLGRNSVPVYAWYKPGAREPELLPQILQEQTIAALFETRPLSTNREATIP